MSVVAVMRVLSAVVVVYRELALDVRCWSYWGIMLPALSGYIEWLHCLPSVVAVC